MPWHESCRMKERPKFMIEYEQQWKLLEGHVNISALLTERRGRQHGAPRHDSTQEAPRLEGPTLQRAVGPVRQAQRPLVRGLQGVVSRWADEVPSPHHHTQQTVRPVSARQVHGIVDGDGRAGNGSATGARPRPLPRCRAPNRTPSRRGTGRRRGRSCRANRSGAGAPSHRARSAPRSSDEVIRTTSDKRGTSLGERMAASPQHDTRPA